MYDDLDYAKQRLYRTIISREGEPVYMQNIYGDGSEFNGDDEFDYEYDGEIYADASTLLDIGSISMHHDLLNSFDLTPVKLGYCNNISDKPSYLMRMPMRNDWRQGLRPENTRVLGGQRGFPRYEDLYKTIKGDYPSVREILETPFQSRYMAFSRHFAIEEVMLKYKGDAVGMAENLNGMDLGLSENYVYLAGQLEDILNENY